jgi:hypothetical protein
VNITSDDALQFDAMFVGRFEWTEKDKKLHELAARYHELTEAYDRTVCTGPIVHVAIQPIGFHEFGLINRNARRVRNEMQRQAAEHGITYEELSAAIRRNA